MPSASTACFTGCIKAGAVIVLLLLPYAASANHGLQALGAVVDFFIMVIGTCVAISFILSLINLRARALWLRVLSILFILPLFAALLFLGTSWPLGSFICAGWLLFQGFLIYLSIPDRATR